MVTIRNEMPFDIDARDDLLDRVWGASRFQKTAERLREGREPSTGLSFVAEHDGDIVGTVRLWDVCAGPGRPAVLLGPLAVDDAQRCRGIGGALMRRAIASARRRKHRAVLLVGDAPITGASVSRRNRPERCGCPGRMSATGCSPASLWRGRLTVRAG
jgi:predicted N-acetyltransferase YhbS